MGAISFLLFFYQPSLLLRRIYLNIKYKFLNHLHNTILHDLHLLLFWSISFLWYFLNISSFISIFVFFLYLLRMMFDFLQAFSLCFYHKHVLNLSNLLLIFFSIFFKFFLSLIFNIISVEKTQKTAHITESMLFLLCVFQKRFWVINKVSIWCPFFHRFRLYLKICKNDYRFHQW